MIEPTITCPSCKADIKLTESLAAPLIEATKTEFEAKIAAKESDVAKREADLRAQHKAIEAARETIDEQVAQKVKAERASITEAEARKAKLAVADDLEARAKEMADLQAILDQKDAKLKIAQEAQADLMRKERELADAKRELEITIETRVNESVDVVRQKAKVEAEESMGMRVAEKEKTISDMQKQIEDLKRKAEQGSQQLQGEVLELALESMLRARFPLDVIEPVGKGEFGGDVLQRVVNSIGQPCGAILWEFKRTKNWSDGWLTKLRGDQRTAKAEIAIIVSNALPKGVESFDLVDGVWVTEPRFILPLVVTLRQSLMEVSNARKARDGQETKMELVYDYLTGPRFRHRVEAVMEKFNSLQEDLNRERKFMMKQWSKPEMEIHGVIESTVGMVGDLQGIAGSAIQHIEGVDLPELEDFSDESA
ncbi:DUF2130 domain-containing protein [Aquidulcibacter paucihalophilus]|uniref:DUF2130 domain-containing protein n=1 Tax=Aquidulcibacter paucihalophilus TaxID=1978549 RepID=UPI000A18D7B7|nr:DUF2130 domain-containing protein [Aquidulcibacter paucihalophilus]